MYHIVETNKNFEQACSDLEACFKQHGFGVLHVHDLGATLRSKGIEFSEQCRVLEVCNPVQAAKVMAIDMRLNMALPCRASVYSEQGQLKIGLIRPVEILAGLSDSKALGEIAAEVEATMIAVVDESA